MYSLDTEFLLTDHVLIMNPTYLRLAGFLFTAGALTLVTLDNGSPELPKKSSVIRKDPPICTFSIVAYDPGQQEWGVAVASKFLAVGAVVPWAKAGAGAIATPSPSNTTYGPQGLELVSKGKSAQEVVKRLTD